MHAILYFYEEKESRILLLDRRKLFCLMTFLNLIIDKRFLDKNYK